MIFIVFQNLKGEINMHKRESYRVKMYEHERSVLYA